MNSASTDVRPSTRQRGTARCSISPTTTASAHSTQGPVSHYHTLRRPLDLIYSRQPGQGGAADAEKRDLRAELLEAEAAHFAKTKGTATESIPDARNPAQRELEPAPDGDEDEDPEAKRRRILEETRDIDADSDGGEMESSDESDDEEDETAELMRELEKIKQERAEQKAREEAEQTKVAEDEREKDIALGNPLLNPKAFNVKRRWDDDVVFKNQARGTEQKGNKEFVNVCSYDTFKTSASKKADQSAGSPEIGFPQEIHGMYRQPQ